MSNARAPRAAGAARDDIGRALDRVTGTRPVARNALRHHPDSRGPLEAMLALVAGARRSVHFEKYIIRSDTTGQRFADALARQGRGRDDARSLEHDG